MSWTDHIRFIMIISVKFIMRKSRLNQLWDHLLNTQLIVKSDWKDLILISIMQPVFASIEHMRANK